MTVTARKIPALRFPEFVGEWEENRLEDIASFVDYRGKSPVKTEHGIFLVTAKNIKFGYIDYQSSQEFVAPDDYQEIMRRGYPKIGDILLTTEAPLGNVAQIDKEDIALAQRVIKIRVTPENENTFLKHLMLGEQFQQLIYSKAIGSTVIGIQGKVLRKLRILVPSLQEQQKIAAFLTTIDTRIQQLSRKKALLEQYKKGVMQQIFSQEIRFKDEDGKEFSAWEEKRLGEIGFLKNGLNKSKEDFGFGHPFVNLMDVFGKSALLGEPLGLVNANYKELEVYNLKKGDVLFIRSSVKREGVGETSVVLNDLKTTVYSGFLIRFREKHEVFQLLFKKYCFSTDSVRNQILSFSTTSANTNVNQESLNLVSIPVPSLQEQQKIAAFLSTIDSQIDLVSQQLERMQIFKKGLLQQMFV